MNFVPNPFHSLLALVRILGNPIIACVMHWVCGVVSEQFMSETNDNQNSPTRFPRCKIFNFHVVEFCEKIFSDFSLFLFIFSFSLLLIINNII